MTLDANQIALVAVVVAVLALVALSGLIWRHFADARRSSLRAWAAAHGRRYVGRDDRFFAVSPGAPFDVGIMRSMRHLMVGPFGDAYVGVAFQFTNLELEGRYLKIRTYSVVALQAPAALPGVLLERETLRTRAGTMVGGQDVELESDDFNRAYRVRADDPRFASDLLNPRTMEVLLRRGTPELRIHGRYLVVHGRGRLEAESVDPVLRLFAEMCDNLPTFVWADRGVELPTPPRPGSHGVSGAR